jgi:hypothetical protein
VGGRYVLSADEKTSIQVRRRLHPTLPIGPHQPMRVEHEYERAGVHTPTYASWLTQIETYFSIIQRKAEDWLHMLSCNVTGFR